MGATLGLGMLGIVVVFQSTEPYPARMCDTGLSCHQPIHHRNGLRKDNSPGYPKLTVLSRLPETVVRPIRTR
jgi:hypothetical protein